MNIKLIAIDMDGTLLNSKKEVSQRNLEALNRALDQGVYVVFSTGRCIAELRQFFPMFPKMRYVLGESGALIYDLKEKKAIHRQLIAPEVSKQILDEVQIRDIMPQVLTRDDAVMNIKDVNDLAHFSMLHYYGHFKATGKLVEDVYQYTESCNWEAEKICLYHTTAQERAISMEKFRDLPVTMAFAETTSLEISANGIDKGIGLQILCNHLSISIEDTAAIGDSFNDISVLKTAGLAVAMGNATQEVKEICSMHVADCDHDGVAEAIDRILE